MLRNPALLALQLLSCWLWLWFLHVVSNLSHVYCYQFLELISRLSYSRSFTLCITYWESIVIASLVTVSQELCGCVGDGWVRRGWMGWKGVFLELQMFGSRVPWLLFRRFPEKTRQALLDKSCRYTPCISSLLACVYTNFPKCPRILEECSRDHIICSSFCPRMGPLVFMLDVCLMYS